MDNYSEEIGTMDTDVESDQFDLEILDCGPAYSQDVEHTTRPCGCGCLQYIP